MLSLIDDIDELLASNKNYLLGKWISDARDIGINPKEKDYFEADARKHITVWGEKARTLNDYANRSIAGLMKDHYGGRWQIFINEAINSLKNNQTVGEKEMLKKVNDFSEDWAERHNEFPKLPIGNTLEISKKLYQKYHAETVFYYLPNIYLYPMACATFRKFGKKASIISGPVRI